MAAAAVWVLALLASLTGLCAAAAAASSDGASGSGSGGGVVNGVAAVAGLAHRLFGRKTGFRLELLPSEDVEIAEVSQEEGSDVVLLRGSTPTALTFALNWYMKYDAGVQVSWSGDSVPTLLPREGKPLPKVERPRTIRRVTRWTIYQNVCTASYSFVWWEWARWERELDWMAANGINMPLAPVGQEYIWARVFQQPPYNISSRALSRFFTGPAFAAWGRMGNIQGTWGGQQQQQQQQHTHTPLWDNFYTRQLELQLTILSRMSDFGMTPIFPAFSGFVPKEMKDIIKESRISASSAWNGFEEPYCCVDFVEPTAPLFANILAAVIAEQRRLYGERLMSHYYQIDLFNELKPRSRDPEYIRNISRSVYKALIAADPQAIWVMQGWFFAYDPDTWGDEQVLAFLSGVPTGRLLVLDLYAEARPQWTRRLGPHTKPFAGHEWAYCVLHNFGGNVGMSGDLETVGNGPHNALQHAGPGLTGIGLTMEGINQNYIIYELAAETAWTSGKLGDGVNVSQWVRDYARRRYGPCGGCEIAWEMLLPGPYNATRAVGGVTKSYVEIRPAVEMKRTGFMPTELTYDPALLEAAWCSFLPTKQGNTISPTTPGYRHDAVDIGRQCLSSHFMRLHEEFISIARNTSALGNALISNSPTLISKLEEAGQRMTELIADIDTLLSTSKHFLLGNWLADAIRCSDNNAGIADIATGRGNMTSLFLYQARNQITLWGPIRGEVSDYASKQWGGLVSGYYLPRWKSFIDSIVDAAQKGLAWNETEYEARVSAFELWWQHKEFDEPTHPNGDSIGVARALAQKYFGCEHASLRSNTQ